MFPAVDVVSELLKTWWHDDDDDDDDDVACISWKYLYVRQSSLDFTITMFFNEIVPTLIISTQ